jgi:hypothetical protein
MYTPYLIQRAEIESPLAPVNTRLSQAVNMDYMGSAEFEFGALPKSFRRIEANADKFIMRKVTEIMEGEACLRVWSSFDDKEFEEYKLHLLRLRFPKTHGGIMNTKESVRFEHDYTHGKFNITNFWWDIDNDVMFGFKKEFMNRVGDYVASSLVYMNEQKKKAA